MQTKTRFCLLCLLLWLTACGQTEQTAEPTPIPIPTAGPNTIVVAPMVEKGTVSPYILGSNYGPWVAVPAQMLPAAFASGVTAIRFPGGAWGDNNDLKPYHIDSFIAFTQQVGAIPTISARLLDATSDQAAELVRYVNGKKDYGVDYWAIGNEPTLFAAELQVVDKAADYDTERFNREWREFALAMREADPTIKLIGPETHQFSFNEAANPKDSAGRDWMIEFLKANGDLVDVVSFHRYPFPSGGNANTTIADLRQHTQEWDKTIVYLRGLIAEHTGRDLPIAITEVNTHYNKAVGGEATPDSHYNAIWLAETFGRLMQQHVFMVNHWMLTSKGGQGGWGIIGQSEVRPSYYVFQLYHQFGSQLVQAESGITDVSAYAAKRDDGALTLMVVNLANETKSASIVVAGATDSRAALWQLDMEHVPEQETAVSLSPNTSLSLPPQSVSLFIVNHSSNGGDA